MHRNLREFLALVKRMGLTVDHLENGRHIKVKLAACEFRMIAHGNDGQLQIDQLALVSRYEALAGSFFVAGGAVDLARQIKALNLLGFQGREELRRLAKIILHSVAETKQLGFF